jgi:hypothetical protein
VAVQPIHAPILSPESQREINGELRDDEKLIWASNPRRHAFTAPATVVSVLAASFLTFLSVAFRGWYSSEPENSRWLILPMISPFILGGVWMLIAPLWWLRRSVRTIYVVTDRRAIVFTTRFFGRRSVESFLPEQLASMTRRQRSNGNGDLIFEPVREKNGSDTTAMTRGFLGLERVREVEELIHETLLAHRRQIVNE